MVAMIGQEEERKPVMLYLAGVAEPVVVAPETEVEEEVVENVENVGEVVAKIEQLQQELAALKEAGAPSAGGKKEEKVMKNRRPVKADPNRKYVRLGELKTWGRVPRQQADLAALLTESMEVGAEWTEEEVFALVTEYARERESLRTSKQHPTYLLAYYRGLKNDGKHAGFVARDFLRVIG